MSNTPPHMAPHDAFSVPEGVRLLSPDQVKLLEQAFNAWRDDAKRADHLLSRERIRLIFLTLRHTGARLGEVLALSDDDLDLDKAIVHLGREGTKRQVPLPKSLCRDLRRVLEGGMAATANGTFFHADQGLVRRAFYARAEACDVPKELASARVLRNTRAVEMLRCGVPLSVAQTVLGQSSPELTAVLQNYSNQDATAIVRRMALGDIADRTSARNSFFCRVSNITKDEVMAEVLMQTAQGQSLCAIITATSLSTLGLEPGCAVTATVKAPLVAVHAGPQKKKCTRRNNITGVITAVRTTPVITEILACTPQGQNLCALISTHTANEQQLKPGDSAQFLFKGLSVVLSTL